MKNNRKEFDPATASKEALEDMHIRQMVGKMITVETQTAHKNFPELPTVDREFDDVLDLIEMQTKTRLGMNTLKRLYGRIDWDKPYNFSVKTKSAICKFLEMGSWEDLIQEAKTSEEWDIRPKRDNGIGVTQIGDPNNNSTIVKSVKKGDTFWVKYLPNRILELEVLGDNQYKVVNTAFTVLKPDDIITVHSFMLGQQFITTEIRRGVKVYPGSHSASGHVITKVARTKKELDRED